MKKQLLLRSLSVALPLALSAVLLLHPSTAASENNSSPNEIQVDNFGFGPATLTVFANTTVTWVNKDGVLASNNGLFKSKALDTDDKYAYAFTKADTYSCYRSIHPKMVGKIVVQ